MQTAKAQAESLLQRLPDDRTYDDIPYHLYVIEKIRHGAGAPSGFKDESPAGRGIARKGRNRGPGEAGCGPLAGRRSRSSSRWSCGR